MPAVLVHEKAAHPEDSTGDIKLVINQPQIESVKTLLDRERHSTLL